VRVDKKRAEILQLHLLRVPSISQPPFQILPSKHPPPDDDRQVCSDYRKHGIQNRPQRCRPYRENEGAGDEQVQVKSKRIRHDAGVIQRCRALRASPPSIRRARYATNIAAMITKAASHRSVQKGILYINLSLFTACVRLRLGSFN
jgi:hypothetical protein